MTHIKIKALSVNRAWQGRRYKTQEYKNYEEELLLLLPNDIEIPAGKLCLEINYGFSNKRSDTDNPSKPFIDILQKKYGFNDSRIYTLIQNKHDVSVGEDFISFIIYSAEPAHKL